MVAPDNANQFTGLNSIRPVNHMPPIHIDDAAIKRPVIFLLMTLIVTAMMAK